MQRRRFLQMSILAPLAMGAGKVSAWPGPAVPGNRSVPDGKPHRFGFQKQQFMLDGRPFQLRCGQMDPIRIPRGYWRHRIRMAKAMGLNSIAIYLMWNALESEPGHFDLDQDRRDFSRFIDICAEEGMWVYLRPGPYVCAEWDFGGLPAWFLRDTEVRVRDGNDAHYMQAVGRYFDAIAPRIRSRMVAQGGPILMLQLENEYASFGKDLGYLESLQSMWQKRGIDGPFSLSDGLPQIIEQKTYVTGTALGLDGGTDFAKAQVVANDAPVWVGEGYTGWLSHWGDEDFQTSAYADTLRQLMDAGRSFNLYEIHGGTNFGFGAGANAHNDGSHFQADLTSYDYGAAINERGEATEEYHRLRAIIAGAGKRSLMDVPEAPPLAEFADTEVQPWASLWDNLPPPRSVEKPRANELLTGQLQGMVLYRKTLRLDKPARLQLAGVHDYAMVFVDGRLVGRISRVQGKGLPNDDTLTLPAAASGPVQLDILIDSFGRVGYGRYMHDRKGLTGEARLDGELLTDWQTYSLPLDDSALAALQPSTSTGDRPGMFFRAKVVLPRPGDNFIDMSAWDKGYVWVNGHLLGRYWQIGPQQRLYCPAEWWKAGDNEVRVLDLHRTTSARIRGMATLHG